jgi:hypothetical protein
MSNDSALTEFEVVFGNVYKATSPQLAAMCAAQALREHSLDYTYLVRVAGTQDSYMPVTIR